MHKIRSVLQVLFCLLFFAGCALLFTGGLFHSGVSSLFTALRDDGSGLPFSEICEKWVSEHFAFRNEAVGLFAEAKAAFFAEGNDQVIVGKEDFLFFSETEDDFLGQNTLSDEEICRIADALSSLRNKAEEKGADFLFVCAPNKNTVYPEYMPSRYRKGEGATNADRLFDALEKRGVPCLDLRSILFEAKSEGLLYHKRDTHWNGRGAGIAYLAICEKTGKSPIDLSSLPFSEQTDFQGDLDSLLTPRAARLDENPRYDFDGLYVYTSAYSSPMDLLITTKSDGKGKLTMFRDSFANALIPFFASSFSSCTFLRGDDYSSLSFPDCDLLLVEIAERNIADLIPN